MQTALEAQRQADARAARAQTALARAVRHREDCESAMHLFVDLDSTIAAETVQQLCDADRSRVELPPDLLTLLTDRDRARVSLAASQSAAEILTKEAVAARGAAAEAATLTDRLIASVLAFCAETIAVEHERLLAEATKVRETLLAFDHFVASRSVGLSQRVRAVLGSNVQEFARRHDQSQWRAAAAQLRADPLATISVGEP
jgi:hypothetical protein